MLGIRFNPPGRKATGERPERERLWPTEPITLDENGRYVFQTYLEYVKVFVARNGAWPGGTDHCEGEELDVKIAQFDARDWPLQSEAFARMPEEIEFADNPNYITARRLFRAIRKDPNSISLGPFLPQIPPPRVLSTKKVAWLADDVLELLLIGERIREVKHRDDGADFAYKPNQIYIFEEDLSDRDHHLEAIKANLDHLSDWQLAKMFSVISAGAAAEGNRLPDKPPRRWEDRTAAERINGRGFISPPEFIAAVWKHWLDKGDLSEDDIEVRDPQLFEAYKRWLRRHPRERLVDLKPGLTPLQRRLYAITPQTPWSEVVKIALAVAKQAQREKKGPPGPEIS